jgi:DNA-binding MarR family transcriptional regulator
MTQSSTARPVPAVPRPAPDKAAGRPTPSLLIADCEFIKPTRSARELCILETLAQDGSLSQQKLGQSSFLSGAMVNQYLRTLQQKGLVRFVPADNKSYTYEPTEAGEDLRRSRYAAYSSELVRLYSALKGCIREKVGSLETKGIRKIALFGASETGEVVLSALADSQFDVLAVVDNDPEKQGKMFKGHVICSPEALHYLPIQAVVITSFGHQDAIYAQIAPLAADKGMEVMKL